MDTDDDCTFRTQILVKQHQRGGKKISKGSHTGKKQTGDVETPNIHGVVTISKLQGAAVCIPGAIDKNIV